MQSSLEFLGFVLVVLGGLGVLTGAAMIRFPSAVRAGLQAFPRSKWPGWILTAVCVFWVYGVVSHAALGRFDVVKPFLPFAAVLLAAAIVYFMDELLAPRALGGLLLLLANPVLQGVRWVDSPWRLVVAVMAYAWVLLGCALILHPWLFRKITGRVTELPQWMRAVGWLKVLGGAVFLTAGLLQFR